MSITKELVREALGTVRTGTSDLAACLLHVAACDTYASVRLGLNASPADCQTLAAQAHNALQTKAQSQGVKLDSFIAEFVGPGGKVAHTARFGSMNPPPAGSQAGSKPPPATGGHTPIPGLRPGQQGGSPSGLPGVRHIVAVGAGKGGVGKSTVALNLAVGLARKGHAVGLLDADIYGPSMPTMLGLESHQTHVLEGMLQPFLVHGIKVMTMGKLVEPDKPLIWRGPMAHGAFKQLTEQTNWGELDYLIIDLPPGTGDIALTMAQMLRLTGAVVVCTPQKVAQDDATRAARMFQQLQIDVLGVVENMSFFVGDDGKVYDIFGRGGAEQMAARLGVPFLGAVPITMSLRANSDKGDPTANFTGSDRAGQQLGATLTALVASVEQQVAVAAMKSQAARPSFSIS
ncbi:MAG TPA: Mrp/NBP35 family ATP-binding protein [Phycisphaerales bacterium]|nr:Mrp/NBP35 family ATP-binding protein [Phycisphaerales bacterium]